MTYASAVLVFILGVSVVYWFAAGGKYYTGPRTHGHIVEGGIVVSDEHLPETLEEKKAISDPGSLSRQE